MFQNNLSVKQPCKVQYNSCSTNVKIRHFNHLHPDYGERDKSFLKVSQIFYIKNQLQVVFLT